MKKQNYLCVDLKTFTQESVKEGQPLYGMMEMTESNEQFEFLETPARPTTHHCNPKIYSGSLITLTRKRDGAFHISARDIVMMPRSKRNARRVIWAWCLELKMVLRYIWSVLR